jgi:hypothetical protein
MLNRFAKKGYQSTAVSSFQNLHQHRRVNRSTHYRPELSSMLATLDELLNRIDATANQAQAETGGAILAADLFAVETLLRSGRRRLDKTLRAMKI